MISPVKGGTNVEKTERSNKNPGNKYSMVYLW